MVSAIEDRLQLARELLQAGREEFARAEEAKGREAVIGLRNACGKGWLAVLEATNCYFLMQGVPESQLPENDRGRKYFVGARMERDMRRHYLEMRETFHIDGYYDASVDFDAMPLHFQELEEYIGVIEAAAKTDRAISVGPFRRAPYPRRNVSTWEAYSSGFSKGTQWPQWLRTTSRESSRLLSAAIPISKTHIRS